MSRFWMVIFVLTACVFLCESLNPKKCETFPKEKHCLIEYRVRDRWPHQIRYVYNWYTQSCFEIRWSDNCPPVSEPPISNNFSSETDCLNECGGWA